MALQNILRTAVVCLLVQRTCSLKESSSSKKQFPGVIKTRHDLDDPIFFYTTTELACSEGYSIQEHKVVTDDGYILTVHRMPNGRNRPLIPRRKTQYQGLHMGYHPDFDDCIKDSSNQTSNGFPLLLVGGVQTATDGWLLQGPGYDLAYILADAGYDVWMINIRGIYYSREHVTLSATDSRFWNFRYVMGVIIWWVRGEQMDIKKIGLFSGNATTDDAIGRDWESSSPLQIIRRDALQSWGTHYAFHEMAITDVPTTIDYILNVTKNEKLGYVGLSMGTTIFYGMVSMRPEYNDKILGSVSLAPVVFIKRPYMNPKRRALFDFLDFLGALVSIRGDHYEIFARTPVQANTAKYICAVDSPLQDLCYDSVVLFMGENTKLMYRDAVHRFLSHFPAGGSMKTFNHYLQNIRRGTFKMYDYGSRRNKELYGSPVPPDYPIWNITVPIALLYTTGDFFYDVRDIKDLVKLLPNVVDVVEYQNFNHADFLGSYKAREMVYPVVKSFFKELIDHYYLDDRRKNVDFFEPGKTARRTAEHQI